MDAALSAQPPAQVEWTLARTDRDDASTEEAASCRLRCSVKDPNADVVGKKFTAAAVELGLASYPGFTLTAPPAPASPYGVYRAEYVDRAAVQHTVVHPDGRAELIPDPVPLPADPSLSGQESRRVATASTGQQAADGAGSSAAWSDAEGAGAAGAGAAAAGAAEPACPPEEIAAKAEQVAEQAPRDTVTRRLPLGTFVHARSGDKGGDANVGLWVDQSAQGEARVAWLTKFVTPERIRELVPEAEDLPVDVYPLPNLGAVNVVIRGLLGQGVAASTRFDPQAKALGEWIRSRHVSITEDLL
jgi:hypothetical protein